MIDLICSYAISLHMNLWPLGFGYTYIIIMRIACAHFFDLLILVACVLSLQSLDIAIAMGHGLLMVF